VVRGERPRLHRPRFVTRFSLRIGRQWRASARIDTLLSS
jgi:hypothetical protein